MDFDNMSCAELSAYIDDTSNSEANRMRATLVYNSRCAGQPIDGQSGGTWPPRPPRPPQ